MGKPPLESLGIPEVPSLEGCFTTQFRDLLIAQFELCKLGDGNIYNTVPSTL